MSKLLFFHLYHFLFIIPIFALPKLTLEDILSFESISCKRNSDCSKGLFCKNGFCQIPTYYCLGNNTCIEEDISKNVYYSHHSNSLKNKEKSNNTTSILSFFGKKNIIIEACHPNHKNCQTRPCIKNSDCFTGICEKETKRCLINKKMPLYACINNENHSGILCGKYIEEECINNDDCLTHQCDTQLHICTNFENNNTNHNTNHNTNNNNKFIYKRNIITTTTTSINNNTNNNTYNNTYNNINNNVYNNTYNNNNNNNNTIIDIKNNNDTKKVNIEDNTDDKLGNNDTKIETKTLIKEGCIVGFVILPVVVFTQYLKSTKTVKNIKKNRKSFEYKTVFVDDLSNC